MGKFYKRYQDLEREAREHIIDYFMEQGKDYNSIDLSDKHLHLTVYDESNDYNLVRILVETLEWNNGDLYLTDRYGERYSQFDWMMHTTIILADLI